MTTEGINLLPSDFQQAGQLGSKFRRVSLYCVVELTLLMAVIIGVYSYHSWIRSQRKTVREEVSNNRAFINQDSSRQLEGKLVVVKGKIDSLGEHFNFQTDIADFFEQITKLLPSGVQMVSLIQNSGAIYPTVTTQIAFTFSGLAENVDQVNLLVNQLGLWKEIDSVSIVTLDYQVDRGMVSFTLVVTRNVS